MATSSEVGEQGAGQRIALPWKALLALAVLGAGLVDVVLIELSSSIFTSGYNQAAVITLKQRSAFVIGSIVLDLSLVLGLWLVSIPVLRRVFRSPTQLLVGVTSLTASLLVISNLIRWEIATRLGELLDLSILNELAGDEVVSSSLALEPELALLPPLLVLILLVTIALAVVAGRADARRKLPPGALQAPGLRQIAAAWAILALLSILSIGITSRFSSAVHSALGRKLSGSLVFTVTSRLSDLDRDGYGMFSGISDPAPLDPTQHHHAIDRPGNGIDENHLAGDHPVGFESVHPIQPLLGPPARRPHILLVYLESVRADLLQAEIDGRPVMPFLSRLARAGEKSEHAYVHSPFTPRSRAQLFGGSLLPMPGQRTLIHDFKDRGYYFAYFSGQDDSFGASEPLVGFRDADLFYDARQDVERRTSRSTHSSSLQVSWKLLVERVIDFLPGHPPETPLFLYVNFVNTHYPYTHGEIDPILTAEAVDRGEIRRQNARRVWETYANSAAGVDRGIEKLVEAWWAHLGTQGAILVTSDHGQAFYEDGFLGHGRALDDAQTRVPLVIWGMRGAWPSPIGAADLRGLLLGQLSASDQPAARFVPDPEHRVFQYLPTVTRPTQIALRSVAAHSHYDLARGRFALRAADGSELDGGTAERQASFEQLVRTWEALRIEAQGERLAPDFALETPLGR